MCQVLGLNRSSPQPQVPVRRKSKIRHSDKPSVAQFREFAENPHVKRRLHERMSELIGGLVLDAELAATGAGDVDGEERRGWDQVHWRAAGGPDICLRGRINEALINGALINEALRVLDESASEADAQFECTFGDSKHARDKPNPKRAGEGFCTCTKLAAGH